MRALWGVRCARWVRGPSPSPLGRLLQRAPTARYPPQREPKAHARAAPLFCSLNSASLPNRVRRLEECNQKCVIDNYEVEILHAPPFELPNCTDHAFCPSSVPSCGRGSARDDRTSSRRLAGHTEMEFRPLCQHAAEAVLESSPGIFVGDSATHVRRCRIGMRTKARNDKERARARCYAASSGGLNTDCARRRRLRAF